MNSSIGNSMLIRLPKSDAGCWILDTGYWILDDGFRSSNNFCSSGGLQKYSSMAIPAQITGSQ
jgi:hypothetical protein